MTNNSVNITLIVVVAVLLLGGMITFGAITMNAQSHPNSDQKITVDGSSVIKVTPDLVTLHFNIETNASNAKDAKDANAVILDKLVTEFVKLGFNRADIKTESYNIYPWQDWENGKTIDRGYKASHQLSVALNSSEASLIGDSIDAGVNAGASLSYINFELSDAKQNEYKAQALKQSGEDARTKAQAIADGLNLKIGTKPISVSTTSFNYQPWNLYSASAGVSMRDNAMEAKVATSNIVPGQQEVSGNIQVVYELK